jgi:TldD protein
MKAKQSEYLLGCKAELKKLLGLLEPHFDYVSVLATDVGGTSFMVSQRQSSISEFGDSERGFVVRTYKNGGYSEYSFNELGNVEELAARIVELLGKQSAMLEGIEKLETPLMYEERLEKEFAAEVPEELYSLDKQAIIEKLKGVSDSICQKEYMIDCRVNYSAELYRKMFLSKNRELIQAFGMSYVRIFLLAFKDGSTQYNQVGDTGVFGTDIIDRQLPKIDEAYKDMIDMFDAPNIEPGEYEVICTPEAAGLIAHEAFGHGVEMDMFVKKRALGSEYIGKRVASDNVTMHEGALCADNVTSYFFDDEGIMAGDVTEIENGILKSGICDALAAKRLGVKPTGNGKRQNFAHKVYTRMTNTIFDSGSYTKDEMIASVKHGYLLEGMQSGMEDPKHWGIQCIIQKGREIRDGKLTGRIVAPVIMTGYVPDLLGNISMCSNDREVFGSGGCGKGHKEWVKVADGGPYLKTRGRLG